VTGRGSQNMTATITLQSGSGYNLGKQPKGTTTITP